MRTDGEWKWRPDIETQMAEITGGLPGETYEDRRRELDELVEAVRREWATKLREIAADLPDPMGKHFYTGIGIMHAADVLDPDVEDPE
ncbi:hypothetical protein ACFU6R_03090 [Streptomyces sp. NPDC057499]|uniref:hypothetical protein n=1 Tax=Streptomyces sp. NPDC057499 TaxID=3346150 RepID=UPI00367E4AB1